MKVKSESEVAQSRPTLSDPVDCSPPGSSVHGILQARILEWGAINYHTIALISHASKIMLNILQARFQKYVNCELSDVQVGFRKGRGTRVVLRGTDSVAKFTRKGRGTRDQIANIRWIIEKAREFKKNIYFCFNDYTEAFDCVDHNKLQNY